MTSELMDTIVNRIADNYQPDKIILFGSCARGNAGKNSDIDLLIVKKTDLDMHQRILEIQDIVPHNFPLDIIVYTPEEFEENKNNKWSFLYGVMKEGKIIYEQR